MITDYELFYHPIITKIHIGPVFHKTYLLNILTQERHFSDTYQEIITFVRDLCLPQQHTPARFSKPCFTTDINVHLNDHMGETMN